MTKTFKKSVSILLSLIMIFSVFAIVPISAGAATYYNGNISFSQLNVGDYITAYANVGNNGDISVKLKAGTYGDLLDVYSSDTVLAASTNIYTENNQEQIIIVDNDNVESYHPYVNGAAADAFYVESKENDVITLVGANAPAHTHDEITFDPWFAADSLPTYGSYFLTEDVTISSMLAISDTSDPLNLCLNGHTVTLIGSGVFEILAGATFNLYDDTNAGSITGGTGYDDDGGAVYVNGGTIEGNTSLTNGGAHL